MSIHVFLGPTIPLADARSLLPAATYHPPVSQGDVVELLRHGPSAIGIIDGLFDQQPAVWHKELLLALSQGVQVVGAASMGALRAAELHTFGMVGVGRVFEAYRDGMIEADDEVAMVHAMAEHEHRPFSEPLVNIRATVEAARAADAIDQTTAERVLAAATDLHYADRTWPALTRDLDVVAADALRRHRTDQKRLDAEALLRHLATWDGDRGSGREAVATDFVLQPTATFHALQQRDAVVATEADGTVLRAEEFVDHLRLDPRFPRIRRDALLDVLLLDLARREDIIADDADRARARQDLGVTDPEGWEAWRERQGLTEDEAAELVEQAALLAKTTALMQQRLVAGDLRRRLRLDDVHRPLADRALQDAQRAATRVTAGVEVLRQAWHDELGGRADTGPADAAALRRLGFDDHDRFVLALEHRYGGMVTPPNRTDEEDSAWTSTA